MPEMQKKEKKKKKRKTMMKLPYPEFVVENTTEKPP